MTTEPKDVRGGDFRPCENEPKTPSDPPPVREAVAWQIEDRDTGWQFFEPANEAQKDPAVWARMGWNVRALYTDLLPVSREAVLMEALEHLRECVKLVPAPGAIEAAERFLAHTGETSRE